MQEHILIIDNNTPELRKLREMFTREGYQVMTATDIETARQLCTQLSVKYIVGEVETLDCGSKKVK
ncbi:MAG: hypothetical protein WCW35_14555 [Bacteroidota bacterium]